MSEENNSPKNKFSLDWLLRGVLTKLGDTVDRFTGRRWSPSSSLATSELIEKLKKLLDLEVKDLGARGKFVPHNIKLKMQWDKFSTDSEDAIRRLENELTIAAVDHINDNRYHTYAPIKLQITPDYFTEGVKLLVTFDKYVEEQREAQVNVTVPQIKVGDYLPELPPEAAPAPAAAETFIANFTTHGKAREVELSFKPKERRSVGRSKENDLAIEDQSVSKIHASLVFNSEGRLLVADTGSTNGTFINDNRIAYGRAFPVENGSPVKFGNIEVVFRQVPRAIEEGATEQFMTNEIVPDNFSASQRDIQTVAFNSNEDIAVPTENTPPPASENVAAQEIVPETRFMNIKPVAPAEATEKTETKRAETQDRINYEFTNEEK